MNRPAFPISVGGGVEMNSSSDFEDGEGMSLLEYYAGQALAGYMAKGGAWLDGDETQMFNVAEAMIKEADKRNEQK